MMIIVRTFQTEFDNYVIVKFKNNNEDIYGAVKAEYITNGKLNRELNGLDMKIQRDVYDLIKTLKFETEIKRIMKDLNCDIEKAFEIYLSYK